ncbi:MAG: hypothetical protein AB7L66_14450, partial [Gemmatimonadales bacterium]
VIKGCLTLPFRLLGLAIMIALGYLAWTHRAEVKRWVHEMTAEPGSLPAEAESPAQLIRVAEARLDSVVRRRADSVLLSPRETEALVVEEVARRLGTLADSVSVQLGDGSVSLRGRIDPARLPANSLGPLRDWLEGPRMVEVGGPIGLLRVGTGEWRISSVSVSRVPLPRPLWEPLLAAVLPGARTSLTFPVDQRVTGVRVTPRGTVLYGVPR